MLASIVIRTLNEARYLPALLDSIQQQNAPGVEVEVVIVDSGSTDGTLAIAERYACKIVHITRQEFSFGRSLNWGCEAATGDVLVIISGHCVPCGNNWLADLCAPLQQGLVDYTYGGQRGGMESRYSETRIFAKYFPAQSQIPQDGFFCNNANAAITREAWQKYRFDEEMTGLEDMELAKRLVAGQGKVGYVAEASVYHYHQESWPHVRRRFEREAIALRHIMPQVHLQISDVLRYAVTSIAKDWNKARQDGVFLSKWLEIVQYRLCQYFGSYKGNHEHRKLSRAEKEHYFFPH